MSKNRIPLSTGARLSVAALAILGYIGGWIIVIGGGFHHKPYRSSPETIFVDGVGAFIMASISFTMSAIGIWALLAEYRYSRVLRLLAITAAMAIPLIFTLLGR